MRICATACRFQVSARYSTDNMTYVHVTAISALCYNQLNHKEPIRSLHVCNEARAQRCARNQLALFEVNYWPVIICYELSGSVVKDCTKTMPIQKGWPQMFYRVQSKGLNCINVSQHLQEDDNDQQRDELS